jgi:hypothetical protein
MSAAKLPHVMEKDVQEQTEKLRRLALNLRKICHDRLEYPGDSERLDDLKDAVLEAHKILSNLIDWFAE